PRHRPPSPIAQPSHRTFTCPFPRCATRFAKTKDIVAHLLKHVPHPSVAHLAPLDRTLPLLPIHCSHPLLASPHQHLRTAQTSTSPIHSFSGPWPRPCWVWWEGDQFWYPGTANLHARSDWLPPDFKIDYPDEKRPWFEPFWRVSFTD